MSDFSDVDRSAGPDRLVRYLDETDAGLVAMKSYIAAAARRAVPPDGLVLDLGCGVGHDLARLAAAGLRPLGIDSSHHMLGRARRRLDPDVSLTQGDGVALPLRSASVDGCRIERVLQHVAEPAAVVAEIRRVLRPGGWFAALEPDHSSACVESSRAGDDFLARLMRALHLSIGAELPALLTELGFAVDDVVAESSFGSSLDQLPVDAVAIARRAVLDGRAEGHEVAAWLDEQRRRTEQGTFRATWVKVLVVARAA